MTIKITKQFNKQQHSKYLKSVRETHKEWYANIRKKVNSHIKGVVLDVGNGGICNFSISKAQKIIAVDICFPQQKNCSKKIDYKIDDARKLKQIKNNSVDIIIFQLVLHHITGKNYQDIKKQVKKSMKSANRVLRNKGKILIIECVVSKSIEWIERVMYPIQTLILKIFKKSPVFEFSEKTILKWRD